MERKAYTAFGETGFGETGRHRGETSMTYRQAHPMIANYLSKITINKARHHHPLKYIVLFGANSRFCGLFFIQKMHIPRCIKQIDKSTKVMQPHLWPRNRAVIGNFISIDLMRECKAIRGDTWIEG